MKSNRVVIMLKAFKYLMTELMPFYFRMLFRKQNNIKTLKNKYFGKRCFIVATGPSLSLEDLELIENEYTFSMNSIVKLFDKTEWRPTFYMLQDVFAYKELKPIEQYFNDTKIILANKLYEDSQKTENMFGFNLRPYKDSWLLLCKRVKFSSDPSKYICDGRTITYSIMQMAHYMGFKEIYLLGVDWNYEKGKDNHMKGLSLKHDSADFIENSHDIQMEAMHISYRSAEKYSRKHGFRIYNASRGGNLDVFERVKLEDLF